MTDRERNDLPLDIDLEPRDMPPYGDAEAGILPGIDLELGEDPEISGGDDLAEQDEENMYGNDVLVDEEDVPGR